MPKLRSGFQRSNILAIVGVIVLLVAIVFFFYAYNQKATKKSVPKDQVEKQDVTVLVEEAKTKTYAEIKEENTIVVRNPNVSSKEAKDKLIEEKVIVADPVNHNVSFNGNEFLPEKITIRQGDSVTFRNNSSMDMTIVGVDDWGNKLAVPPKKAFTQSFDFKGNYKYSSALQPFPSGVIVVE